MKRICAIAALAVSALLLMASAASAQVAPGTYQATFNAANAPSGTHVANNSDQPICVVATNLDVNCNNYNLGGVGNTNATVSLVANYSATIDCTNHGGNLVESHTTAFSDSSTATIASTRNGQLRVPAQEASAFSAPQVCPNPNWTPSIRAGTLTLEDFTYTLTFAGFSSPYITISAT
jgi:hypothetical protein